MLKILIINNIDDINSKTITHFSLDKGLYLGHGLKANGHDVYFITNIDSYIDIIKFINIKEANIEFLNTCDLIIIIREAEIENILENYYDLKNVFLKRESSKSKIMIKSDSTKWISNKEFRKYLSKELKINGSQNSITQWINKNINYICVQNEELKIDAIKNGVTSNRIIVSNMSVPKNIEFNIKDSINPYDINHSYCKLNYKSLNFGDGLYPKYYEDNPDQLIEFNKKKNIIIYTGRIKTDNGKTIYLMKEIMDILGNDYELHIFPGSFYLNINNNILKCSAKNIAHLLLLRDNIFKDNKNVIIHYPYEHKYGYKYLYHATCGIDFSPSRPKNEKSLAGNAKLLDYCSMGLPVVCEKNANNSFLVKHAGNGILINGIGVADDYVKAIKMLCSVKVDRMLCRKITVDNENWDIRAKELIKSILDKK